MNKKMIIGVVIAGIVVCLLGMVSIKNYVDRGPKLTVKEIGNVEAGQTLALSDMVDVECKGDYRLALVIDSEITDARVSEDKQSLFVGSSSGTIRVMISGYGEVAEFVSDEIVIHVNVNGDREAHQSVINTASFSLSIPDQYKLQEDESSENEKYFERENPATVILVYDTTAGNADLEANVKFYKSMLAESYGISDSEIKASPSPITNHDQCYYLTWEYKKDGHDYTAVSYMIYEEGTVLVLTENGDTPDEESMKEELLGTAQTVNYTGDYHLPGKEEYPFSVENAFVRVTVPEGFDSPHKHYTSDSDMLVVRYTAADDYDKGLISKLVIEYLEDQDTLISDQAEKEYQRLQSGDMFEVLPLEELKLGEVWSELSDTNLSGMTAYMIKVWREETNFSTDKYYVEINNNKFCIHISYPFENEGAKDEMYQLFDQMSPVFKGN